MLKIAIFKNILDMDPYGTLSADETSLAHLVRILEPVVQSLTNLVGKLEPLITTLGECVPELAKLGTKQKKSKKYDDQNWEKGKPKV